MLIRQSTRLFAALLSSLCHLFCRHSVAFLPFFVISLRLFVTLLLIVLGICQKIVIWGLKIGFDLDFEDLGLGFGIWDLGFYNQDLRF